MPITAVAEPLASPCPSAAAAVADLDAALSQSSSWSLLVSSASATLYRPDPGRQRQQQALPIVADKVTFCTKLQDFAPSLLFSLFPGEH